MERQKEREREREKERNRESQRDYKSNSFQSIQKSIGGQINVDFQMKYIRELPNEQCSRDYNNNNLTWQDVNKDSVI